MKITAHRGASGDFIELSEAAIEAAARSDCDRIEMDFHVLASGQLVAMHDVTVDRTTDGHGLLSEMTLDEFRRLHLLDHYGQPTAERPLLLAEAWDIIAGRKALLGEKKAHGDSVQIADFIHHHISDQMLAAGGFQIQSFWRDELAQLKAAVPAVQTGILYHGKLSHNHQTDCFGQDLSRPFTADELASLGIHAMFNMAAQYIVPEDVELLHSRGLEVNAYVVNNLDDAHRLEALAVDGVITDFPSQFALAC